MTEQNDYFCGSGYRHQCQNFYVKENVNIVLKVLI